MKLKTVRRMILGILLLAVGSVLEGFTLIGLYNILSGVIESNNLAQVIGFLPWPFGLGLIALEKGRDLINERKQDISLAEEKIKMPYYEAKEKINKKIAKAKEKATVIPKLLVFVVMLALFSFGVATLIGGSVSLIIYVLLSPNPFSLTAGSFCVPTGVLALRGLWCVNKGRFKRGSIFALIAILIFLLFAYVSLNYDL